MPAAKRRGLAVGRGSPVYQVVCGQGGPVMPDEKLDSEKSMTSPKSRKQQQPKWPLRRRLARRGKQEAPEAA